MQENEFFEKITDFAPGLVTNIAHALMPNGAGTSITSMDVHDVHGEIRSRYSLGTTAGTIAGGVFGVKYIAIDGAFYYAQTTGATVSGRILRETPAGTVTTIASMGTVSFPVYFCEFQNNIIVSTPNVGGLFKIPVGTGTASRIAGYAKTPKELAAYRNRVYVHEAATNTTVDWSEWGDVDTWDASGNVQIEPNDGDQITSMMATWHHIYFGKSRHIYAARGEPEDLGDLGDFELNLIAGDIGIAGQWAVAPSGAGFWFLGPDGIYSLYGSTIQKRTKHIQKDIRRLYRTYPGVVGTPTDMAYVPSAAVFEGKFVLSCADQSGKNNLVYQIDMNRETVAKSNVKISALQVISYGSRTEDRIYGFTETTGGTLTLDYLQDTRAAGESFTFGWVSGRLDGNAPNHYKELTYAMVEFATDATSATSLSVKYTLDDGQTVTVTGLNSGGEAFFGGLVPYKWIQLEVTGTIPAGAQNPTIIRKIVLKGRMQHTPGEI